MPILNKSKVLTAMPLFYAFPAPVRPWNREMPLILYQRDDCPLCDRALAVLAQARVPDFDSVWIDGDDALEAAYGSRVPVLRDASSGRELDWPFDASAAAAWLQGMPPAAAAGRDLPAIRAAEVGTRTEAPIAVKAAPAGGKLEDTVENALFGVFAYTIRAVATTIDAVSRPIAFARALPSARYCRPTTYFVIAMFFDTLLSTALLSLERAGKDAIYDRKATAQLFGDLSGGAVGGNWSSVMMTLAPLIAAVALFAMFLHLSMRKRYGGDFKRCFGLSCYSVAAPTFLRGALMATLLPMMAAAPGSQGGAFGAYKTLVLSLVIALQAYPVVLIWLYLREWIGSFATAIRLWLQAAACTLAVAAVVAAWSYPLWKDVVRLPGL